MGGDDFECKWSFPRECGDGTCPVHDLGKTEAQIQEESKQRQLEYETFKLESQKARLSHLFQAIQREEIPNSLLAECAMQSAKLTAALTQRMQNRDQERM